MKTISSTLLTCLVLFSACGNDHVSSVPGEKLIIPGESIGKTKLGMAPDSVIQLLGKPDYSDAAMGKALMIWYGKNEDAHNNRTEVDVMVAYRDTSMRDKAVKQIRITSDYFVTKNGVKVHDDLYRIMQHFPDLSKSDYHLTDTTKAIYDDTSNGISFEVAAIDTQRICTAILVHAKNTPFVINYLAVP